MAPSRPAQAPIEARAAAWIAMLVAALLAGLSLGAAGCTAVRSAPQHIDVSAAQPADPAPRPLSTTTSVAVLSATESSAATAATAAEETTAAPSQTLSPATPLSTTVLPTTLPATPRTASSAPAPRTTKPAPKPPAPKPKPTTPPQPRSADRVITQELLAAVNGYRRQAGVAELSENSCADASALIHAKSQAAVNRMYHRTLSQVENACKMVGGENIAFGYATPAAVLKGWWGSSGHRANMLDARYRYMGVAVAYSASGTPYYTQVFYIP